MGVAALLLGATPFHAVGARAALGQASPSTTGYGPLVPRGDIASPAEFNYQIVSRQGVPMGDGRPTPGIFDAMGAFRPYGDGRPHDHHPQPREPEASGRDPRENPPPLRPGIVVPQTGDIFICEYGAGEQFVCGLTLDGEIYDFAQTITNDTEFCGATFDPDALPQPAGRARRPRRPLREARRRQRQGLR